MFSYLIKKQIQQQKQHKNWQESNDISTNYPNTMSSSGMQFLGVKGDRSENETDHQSMLSASTMYATAMSFTSRESAMPLIPRSMMSEMSHEHVHEFEGLSEDFYETSV